MSPFLSHKHILVNILTSSLILYVERPVDRVPENRRRNVPNI